MSEQQPHPKPRTIKVEQKTSPSAISPSAMLERQLANMESRMDLLETQMATLQQTWNSLLNVANRAVIIQQLQNQPINPQVQEPPKPQEPQAEAKPMRSIPYWEREKGITEKPTEDQPTKKPSKAKWVLLVILTLLIIGLLWMFFMYNQGYVFFWQAESWLQTLQQIIT